MSKPRSVTLPRPKHPAARRIVSHRLFRRMLAYQGVDLAGGWRGCEEMIFRALQKYVDCPAP